MKTARMAILMASLLMSILSIAAYAQEPSAGKTKGHIGAQGVGALGLNDPPPVGYSVLYMFTGVINDTSAREATVVHCTNFGANTVDVGVQAWDRSPTTTYSGTLTLNAGQTGTFATQNIVGFPQDEILGPLPPGIYMGSGRVLTQRHAHVICTAQVMDPTNDPPGFVVKLALFDSDGSPVGEVRKVYLPLILKFWRLSGLGGDALGKPGGSVVWPALL